MRKILFTIMLFGALKGMAQTPAPGSFTTLSATGATRLQSSVEMNNNQYFTINALNSSGWKNRAIGYSSSFYQGTTGNFIFQLGNSASTAANAAITWRQMYTILNNGNFGIGNTATPRYRLQLSSDTTIFALSPTASGGWRRIVFNDVNTGTNTLAFISLDGTTKNYRFGAGSTTATGYFTTFDVDGVERVRINSTGVGIGTNTPGNRVHIVGATTGTSGLRLGGFASATAPTPAASNGKALSVDANGDVILVNAASGGGFTLPALTSGSLLFSDGTTIAQNNANLFWDNTNTRLGIGTTTPSNKLHIVGASGTSGLRFGNLNSASTAAAANGKTLSLDANGDVILVSAPAGFSLPALTNGSVLYSNGTTIVENNTNFNWDNGSTRLNVNNLKVNTLSGTGTRMVVAGADGVLTTQAIPATAAADNMGNHTATQNIALNNFALTNNGTGGGIKITNTGYVGIGTSTPSAFLDIRKDDGNDGSIQFFGGGMPSTYFAQNYFGIASTNGSPRLVVNSQGNTSYGVITVNAFEDAGGPFLLNGAIRLNPGNVNSTGFLEFLKPDASTLASISSDTSNLFYQTITGVNHIFKGGNVVAENNVGIGTTTPANKLHVVGASGTSGLRFGSLNSTSTAGAANGKTLSLDANGDVVLVSAPAGFSLPTLTSGSLLFSNGSTIAQNNSKLFWDNTNFRLGVGTTTPAKALDVVGGVKVSDLAGTGSRMVVAGADGILSTQAIPATAAADNMGNHTASQNIVLGSNALVNSATSGGINIGSTGNVGIGITSPNEKLVVQSASNRRLAFGGGTTSTLTDFGTLGSAITFSRPSD
ncbi:MAG: beta strand repeat-containing protein, partial [Leadbetterella sp.]